MAYPNNILYERNRFAAEGIHWFIPQGIHCQLIRSEVPNATRQSGALTIEQTVSLLLRYLACAQFMYSIDDAENFSKNTVLQCISQGATSTV